MEWLSFGVIFSHLIANMIGIVSGWFIRLGRDSVYHRRQYKGQRALLSGLQNPTIFVYPPRPRLKNEDDPTAILPAVISIEDFLAINNVISAFLRVDWERPAKIKDTDPKHLTDEDKRHNNLILICSSKTNKVTGDALLELRKRYPHLRDVLPAFELVSDVNTKACRVLLRFNGGIYESPSYDQPISEDAEIEDYAILAKAINPWSPHHRLLIVAGLRGVGTWGAAETLKKWWQELYDKKGHNPARGISKQGNFVAVLRIRYKKEDIKKPDLVNMIDLDQYEIAHREP